VALDGVIRMSSLTRLPCLLLALLLAGCATHLVPAGPTIEPPRVTTGAFVMPDGMRLPYRAWLPTGEPWAVMLALHGMDDSGDAMEIPAPDFTDAGIAVFSPDQRGFGATVVRGYWPGTRALVDDARQMAALLRARYPHARLVLLGESMGAAVLMCLATEPDPPAGAAYVLVAPAVWARSEMNAIERGGLWLASNLMPGLTTTGEAAHVRASDNRQALIRLSRDPLTIHATRFDTIKGLVDLMDAAAAATPRFDVPALVLYGGKDELIPPRAMARVWRALPSGPVRAFYPGGYHLLLRDLERAAPIGDIIDWLLDRTAPLPSGAEEAVSSWLARQP
jgi:alpha-beta hydrolase superfamily lysophospholipase